MLKLTPVIARIDKTMFPGNRFAEDDKTQWIYEVDAKAFDELISQSLPVQKKFPGFWYKDEEGWHEVVNGEEKAISERNGYISCGDPLNQGITTTICRPHRAELKPYRYAEEPERRLLLPDRFVDVYIHYCGAKMAAADNEIEEYNNQALLYEASWQEYASWYIRHHRDRREDGYFRR